MNVESVLQTVLITTLLGILPKILEQIWKILSTFDVRRVHLFQQKSVTVRYEAKRGSSKSGGHIYSLSHSTVHELGRISEIIYYISHRCENNASLSNVPDWTSYEGKLLPTQQFVLDGIAIHYAMHSSTGAADGNTVVTQTMTLQASQKSELDDFLKRVDQYEKQRWNTIEPRYLVQNVTKGETFWTYSPLSTFGSWERLFFAGKSKIRKAVNNLNETNKLSLLLHGPPGTGKTSLIRAIASSTERSIVNVDLALIANNQELHSIFFNPSRNLQDKNNVGLCSTSTKLIYVFEEFDTQLGALQTRSKRVSEFTRQDSEDVTSVAKLRSSIYEQKQEALTIGGLLTLLDGIQQLRDVIVIMTTNHKEKIDERLLRAGRITYDIELGPMKSKHAKALVAQTFPNLDVEPRDRFWIPARLEQLLATHSKADDFQRAFAQEQS